jgi:uncharacterized membrane protein
MKNKTLFITQFAMMLALEALFSFTPLGSIPIGPIVATLGGVPIVITAILLGTGAGALMGGFAGLFSLIVWSVMPPTPLMAFVFSPFYTLGPFTGNFFSVIISFVPRVLIGVFAGAAYKFFINLKSKGWKTAAYGISGVAGSFFANTVLVLSGIYCFFGRQYAEAFGIEYSALLGIIGLTVLTGGIPEAVICALAASFICVPLKRLIPVN